MGKVVKNAKLLAQNFLKISKYPIIIIILMMMPYIESFENIFPENLPVLGGRVIFIESAFAKILKKSVRACFANGGA